MDYNESISHRQHDLLVVLLLLLLVTISNIILKQHISTILSHGLAKPIGIKVKIVKKNDEIIKVCVKLE
jgi:hypothetical protein